MTALASVAYEPLLMLAVPAFDGRFSADAFHPLLKAGQAN